VDKGCPEEINKIDTMVIPKKKRHLVAVA